MWVLGRWCFLGTVIDAYSRSGVARDPCWRLTDSAMPLLLSQAPDRPPEVTPEIVTDTAPEFIGRGFLLACQAGISRSHRVTATP